MVWVCDAEPGDNGRSHHSSCYCGEDQGSGYTYSDEYGDCPFCLGEFPEGTIICANAENVMRACPAVALNALFEDKSGS